MDGSTAGQSTGRSLHAKFTLPLSLLAFACLIYANSANNGFVLDDTLAIQDNPLIRSLENIETLHLECSSAGPAELPIVLDVQRRRPGRTPLTRPRGFGDSCGVAEGAKKE